MFHLRSHAGIQADRARTGNRVRDGTRRYPFATASGQATPALPSDLAAQRAGAPCPSMERRFRYLVGPVRIKLTTSRV